MTPRPPHIRDRMLHKIASQIAALPSGGAWQLDQRLAALPGLKLEDAIFEIGYRFKALGAPKDVRGVTVDDILPNGERRKVAVFLRPYRCPITGQVFG